MKIGNIILSGMGAIVLLFSCAKDSDYTLSSGLSASSIISISSIVPDSVYADSSSSMIIRVSIDPQTDSVQNITLTTSQGSINGSGHSVTGPTNQNRYVDFILKAGQVPGPVALHASVLSNYSRDSIIKFMPAYPDTVIVQISSIIAKNTSASFAINLIRFSGYPSSNQKIIFSALDSTGTFQGTFSTLFSFVPGSPLNVSYMPASNFAGHIKLQAFVLKTDGTRIASSISNVNIQ